MSREYLKEHAQHFEFRRRFFRIFLGIAFFLLLINLSLIVLTAVNKYLHPNPPYFITTSDGRVLEIQPINR